MNKKVIFLIFSLAASVVFANSGFAIELGNFEKHIEAAQEVDDDSWSLIACLKTMVNYYDFEPLENFSYSGTQSGVVNWIRSFFDYQGPIEDIDISCSNDSGLCVNQILGYLTATKKTGGRALAISQKYGIDPKVLDFSNISHSIQKNLPVLVRVKYDEFYDYLLIYGIDEATSRVKLMDPYSVSPQEPGLEMSYRNLQRVFDEVFWIEYVGIRAVDNGPELYYRW